MIVIIIVVVDVVVVDGRKGGWMENSKEIHF
jgi:hypothetical protein